MSLFYMCITSGEHAGKAEDILRFLDAKMLADDIPWDHAVAPGKFITGDPDLKR